MDNEFNRASAALGDRLKQTCRQLKLDVTTAAQRTVAERIVNHFNAGFGPSPAMLCGGLLFPQVLRSTSDADLRVVRRYSDTEIHNAMGVISELLRSEGIDVRNIKTPRQLDVGTGVPVTRVEIEASCGGIRANTHLDLTLATGQDALPDHKTVIWTEFQSFMRAGPSYCARAQPLETAAAEKWIAVITKERTDMRMKHETDLILLGAQDLDVGKVASEVLRTCRHRGIDTESIDMTPPTLAFPEFVRRCESWTSECQKRRLEMSLDAGFSEIHEQWQELREAIAFRRKQELFRHFQSRQHARRALLDIEFGIRPASEYGDNVVAFRHR